MKKKPVVGQIVYSLNVGNAARNCEQVLTEMVVTSVGRKYFDCREPGHMYASTVRFRIETWEQDTRYCADHCIYESRQEWEAEKRRAELLKWFRNAFDIWSRPAYSTPALEAARAILEADEKGAGK